MFRAKKTRIGLEQAISEALEALDMVCTLKFVFCFGGLFFFAPSESQHVVGHEFAIILNCQFPLNSRTVSCIEKFVYQGLWWQRNKKSSVEWI